MGLTGPAGSKNTFGIGVLTTAAPSDEICPVEHTGQACLIVNVEHPMNLRIAQVGVDEQNRLVQLGQRQGEIAGDEGLARIFLGPGHQDNSRKLRLRFVAEAEPWMFPESELIDHALGQGKTFQHSLLSRIEFLGTEPGLGRHTAFYNVDATAIDL